MRTTLTIDDALLADLKETAHATGEPLKAVVNRALRIGLEGLRRGPRRPPFQPPVVSMGVPRVDLTAALRLAGELEDEEIARKLSLRK